MLKVILIVFCIFSLGACSADGFLNAEDVGAEALHARLAEVDPASAVAIHANNVKRVIRALEYFKMRQADKYGFDEDLIDFDAKDFVNAILE